MFTPTLISTPAVPDPRIGQLLCGKWRIQRVLGTGSMAKVYAARHIGNGKRVAVKVLHSSLAGHRVARERMLNEARTANRIGHRAVVGVYDEGETPDGSVFLVMDLLDGATLEEHARSFGKLPCREALLIASQVLDVLGAAHAQGVVHRDIKPENIFIREDGRVTLLDFGVARSQQARSMTQMGVPIGTPAFMPPEQAAGNWHLVDERSDLWALGATLFTLISGETVRPPMAISRELEQAATQPVRSLASVCDAPPVVVSIVDRALRFEREARFPDAHSMLQSVNTALGELGGGDGVGSSADSPDTDTASGLRRRALTVDLPYADDQLVDDVAVTSSWLRAVRGRALPSLLLRTVAPVLFPLSLLAVLLSGGSVDVPAESPESARTAPNSQVGALGSMPDSAPLEVDSWGVKPKEDVPGPGVARVPPGEEPNANATETTPADAKGSKLGEVSSSNGVPTVAPSTPRPAAPRPAQRRKTTSNAVAPPDPRPALGVETTSRSSTAPTRPSKTEEPAEKAQEERPTPAEPFDPFLYRK